MTLSVRKNLRLSETEYFPGIQEKSGIAIHHTVSASAAQTFDLWRADRAPDGRPSLIATAYIIEPDGTIYEVFDPAAWAWQFGLGWSDTPRIAFEKRFIGIELVSEGGLREVRGLLYAYDRVAPETLKPASGAYDAGQPWRGYRWFDRYERPQLNALGDLVGMLCRQFQIPRQYPDQPFEYYGDALRSFKGVIGHTMVRPDKSDPAPDPRVWSTLRDRADLEPVQVAIQEEPEDNKELTSRAIEALFSKNVVQINGMDVAAGSLVKAFVMELERRRTYLQLDAPTPAGYGIPFELLQGDSREVARLAKALGIAEASKNMLRVPRA